MTSARVKWPGTVRAGLSTQEAARRLAADGRNDITPPAPPSPLCRTLRLLGDPLIILLLLAATVTTATGDIPDTAVILLVIVVNTVIGVAQETRADRAVAALRQLGAPHCRVVRDGADVVIPAAETVRGDLVRLAAGDIVPADIGLVEAHRLQIDESAVTGESVPVDRTSGAELSAGTVVAAGRGEGTVVRVGSASALGRIAALTATARGGPTPLQRRLARLGVAVLWTGGVIGACALAVGATAAHLGLARQTLTFLALGFSQLGVAIAVRAPRRAGHTNPWLGAAVALSAALMLAGVYLAPLRALLGTRMPGPVELLVVLAVATLPGLMVGAVRRWRR